VYRPNPAQDVHNLKEVHQTLMDSNLNVMAGVYGILSDPGVIQRTGLLGKKPPDKNKALD